MGRRLRRGDWESTLRPAGIAVRLEGLLPEALRRLRWRGRPLRLLHGERGQIAARGWAVQHHRFEQLSARNLRRTAPTRVEEKRGGCSHCGLRRIGRLCERKG